MQHQQGPVVVDQMPDTTRKIYEQEDKSREREVTNIL